MSSATIYFDELQDFCYFKGFMSGKEFIAEKFS